MSHPIPKTSIEKLKEVLAGYNKVWDAGDEIDDSEVAAVRDVSQDIARRQKKFLEGIGVLEKDGRSYLLTEEGHELGRLVRFNEDDAAGKLLREFLDGWEPTEEVLAHVDGEMGLEELSGKVALVTANELSTKRKKTGARTVIELLEWAGYIEESNGKYSISEESQETETVANQPSQARPESPEPAQTTEQPHARPVAMANGATAQTGNIDISLDISGSDDPENVRQLLLAIRRGSQGEIDGDGEEEE